MEPRDAELEAAASAYVEAVTTLEPLLKEADDYYEQEDYKDDKMAKGKALHPKLMAAWDAFEKSDKALALRHRNHQRPARAGAACGDRAEGSKKARYHVESLMIQAKRVLRAEDTAKPDVAAITQALNDYEESVKAVEQFAAGGSDGKVGSFFISNAKSFLTTRSSSCAVFATRRRTRPATG